MRIGLAKYFVTAFILAIVLSITQPAFSFRSLSNSDSGRVYEPKEVDQKARITYKPAPPYTREARERCVSGTVVVRVVLAESGEVGEVTVVKGLSDGLTEQCVRAARGIKFEPAMKDGHKVSQYLKTEYNFQCR